MEAFAADPDCAASASVAAGTALLIDSSPASSIPLQPSRQAAEHSSARCRLDCLRRASVETIRRAAPSASSSRAPPSIGRGSTCLGSG